ncbi:MAG: DUF3575 domain-containing protein [Salibacteraceae bacterium]
MLHLKLRPFILCLLGTWWSLNLSGQSGLLPDYDITQNAQLEENRLLKLRLQDFQFSSNEEAPISFISYSFMAGVEQKMDTAWSLQASIVYAGFFNNNLYRAQGIGLELGGRYYYRLRKRIRSGKAVNNFCDYYFGSNLKWGFSRYAFTSSNTPFEDTQFSVQSYSLSANWGRQFYLDRKWLLDLGLGIDIPLYRSNQSLMYPNWIIPSFQFGFSYRI